MKFIVKLCLFVLVFTSCTKSSNNGGGVGGGGNNGTTINYSDYYAEITFNGNTYKTTGSSSTGALVYAITTINYPFSFDTINLITLKIDYNISNVMIDGTFIGDLGFYKPLGGLTTGVYKSDRCKWKNGQSLGSLSSSGSIIFKNPQTPGDLISTKDSSLSVNITNINSKSIEGTFNCILQNISGEYPATGKFKAYRP